MQIQGTSQEAVAAGYTLASQKDRKHAKVYEGRSSHRGKTTTPAKRRRGDDPDEPRPTPDFVVEIPPRRRRPRTPTDSDDPDFEPRRSKRLRPPPIPVKAKEAPRQPKPKVSRGVQETTVLRGYRFIPTGSSETDTPLGRLHHQVRSVIQPSEMHIIESQEDREEILSAAQAFREYTDAHRDVSVERLALRQLRYFDQERLLVVEDSIRVTQATIEMSRGQLNELLAERRYILTGLAVMEEAIGIPVDRAALPPLNPAERSPDPNDTRPPTFQEDMDDLYDNDAGPMPEDKDAIGEADAVDPAVEKSSKTDEPVTVAAVAQDVERRSEPMDTEPATTRAEPVEEPIAAPTATDPPVNSRPPIVLPPSPLPAVPMELDPPVDPPTVPAILTLTEMQETIASQPVGEDTAPPATKTEETKEESAAN